MAKRKRRSNHEGTIVQRKDGRWEARISIPGTGRRRSIYGASEKEVREKRDQLLYEIRMGLYVEPQNLAFGEWIKSWLEIHKNGQIKQTTYADYERLIRVHIVPSLGHIMLDKLTATAIQNYYNEKLKNGRVDGTGGLSTRDVRTMHVIIKQSLEQAMREGLVNRNVAELTNPPVIKKKSMQVLNEDELLKFFAAAKEHRLFPLYFLLATSGLRRGEACGLCWNSVNLITEPATISIHQQLLPGKNGPIIENTTKTKTSRRIIPITDDAKEILKEHKIKQNQEKLLFGETYEDNNLVFCRVDGSPLRPEQVTRTFQSLLAKAGVKRITLHELRHTTATLLLARGVHPKVTQALLGHSSVSITLDTYSHLIPGLTEIAASSLNGLLDNIKKESSQNLGS